jgi:3-dehydroquinate synthase
MSFGLRSASIFFKKESDFKFKGEVLFCDEALKERSFELFKNFEKVIFFNAGEKFKSFDNFSVVYSQVSGFKDFWVLGGGSSSDFFGLFFSTYRRGVEWNYIPSTWLAAIDAGLGGKNAVNIENTKNQFGSFQAIKKIFLIEGILNTGPAHLVNDAWFEAIKMGLISSINIWESLKNTRKIGDNLLELIELKLKIVDLDPYEKIGMRKYLNFGHTYGHVLELTHGISHGTAVGQGMIFALRFSHHKGFLPDEDLKEILEYLPSLEAYKFTKDEFVKLLKKDKKFQNEKIDFVYLKKIAIPFIEKVSVDEVYDFYQELMA